MCAGGRQCPVKHAFIRMFVLVLLLLAGIKESHADDAMTVKFVFEYCHSNAARDYTLSGLFIDSEGNIWTYNHSGEPWWPSRSDGLLYEFELKAKYRDAKPAGNVDKAVLSAMILLIEPASQAELARRKTSNDIGSVSYTAYLYNPAEDTYKEVILSSKGDQAIENSSNAAKTLVQWLESAFVQKPTVSIREESQKAPLRGDIKAGTPHPKGVRKMPAPKYEIKIEQKGPFPVKNRE